uniref:neurocan core protein-like n=1 Tax=Doryrhamphus excisus TaxID=161450 RepID=UPI0025ADCEDD|nr:neurocan core protein-like [Doryrhamphus excisus]
MSISALTNWSPPNLKAAGWFLCPPVITSKYPWQDAEPPVGPDAVPPTGRRWESTMPVKDHSIQPPGPQRTALWSALSYMDSYTESKFRSDIAQMAFNLSVFLLLCGTCVLLTGAFRPSEGKGKGKGKECRCPKGWTQYQDYCYIYQDYNRAFADAERVCQLFHGNLVSICDEVENAVILQLIRDHNDGNLTDTWIGLHDTLEEGDYLWTDGTFLRFDDFGVLPTPPEADGNDCVEIEDFDGRWDDDNCTDLNPYVCIRPVCINAN